MGSIRVFRHTERMRPRTQLGERLLPCYRYMRSLLERILTALTSRTLIIRNCLPDDNTLRMRAFLENQTLRSFFSERDGDEEKVRKLGCLGGWKKAEANSLFPKTVEKEEEKTKREGGYISAPNTYSSQNHHHHLKKKFNLSSHGPNLARTNTKVTPKIWVWFNP